MRSIYEITINGKALQEILDVHYKYLTTYTTEGRANLSGANLSDADLSGANLSDAIGVYAFGPIGKFDRIGYAVTSEDGPMFALGCHWGNLAETRKAIVAKYGKGSLYEKQVVLAGKIVMEKK